MRLLSVTLLALLLPLLSVPAQAVADPGTAVAAAAPGGGLAQKDDRKKSSTWKPPAGATFNNPLGRKASRDRVHDRIHDAIRNTPRGSTIRIATYNLDRRNTAKLLMRARKRGVAVQIVVNDNLINPVIVDLQNKLGKNPKRRNFLVICKAACRSPHPGGNQHMKIASFSRSGAAKHVVISTSGNLTYGAAAGQWNDAFSVVGDASLYNAWTQVFTQLKKDRSAKPRQLVYQSETVWAQFQRQARSVALTPASGDQQYARLKQVSCKTAPGFGAGGRTKVRINMYAWYGKRGERLAKRVATMAKHGCKIHVVGSVVGDSVVRILQRAGIPVRVADWDWGMKDATSGKGRVYGARCYAHLKYVTVDGKFRGRNTKMVWTGSENWSGPGLSSDEVTFEIHDRKVLAAYNKHWYKMWKNNQITHAPGIEPIKRPCA
ncbi:hypothetical protein JK386_10675 [Nocardioides sp. zg-536]|uniref:phospholipase D n=1 Tax=Nocardioides faecalis TaxID=2803858 RepID=A0A938Y1C9_9ACTN|nr:phospholipase D-like domain-containing protein [Nocardioides faecalis]MBM9460367.1 hypothetical protein [Nocardioides faecalis]MBS4751292.1 hypothetical protein [Nocardioides faecalis]QVI59805.1 hypothetical protein KG111_05585 [Nocardioides faecalis]